MSDVNKDDGKGPITLDDVVSWLILIFIVAGIIAVFWALLTLN